MEILSELFGLHAEQLNSYQMTCRAIVIFFIALFLIRVTGLRTFGKHTVFDQLTVLILGSILGRSIVTNQPLLPTIVATLVVMLLHKLLAWLTFKNHWLGIVVKGRPVPLMKEGEQQYTNMKRQQISRHDIEERLRLSAKIEDASRIESAFLERSGQISIILKDKSKES